jgi:hypothetical protein
VDTQIEFVDCPAHVDDEGTLRCGLPAEDLDRFNLRSTDGWLAAAMIACPAKHRFSAPLDSLDAKRRRVHSSDCPKRTDRPRPRFVSAPGVEPSS